MTHVLILSFALVGFVVQVSWLHVNRFPCLMCFHYSFYKDFETRASIRSAFERPIGTDYSQALFEARDDREESKFFYNRIFIQCVL